VTSQVYGGGEVRTLDLGIKSSYAIPRHRSQWLRCECDTASHFPPYLPEAGPNDGPCPTVRHTAARA